MLARLLPFIMIVNEYQRAAVFRMGRIAGYRGPGLVWRWPFIERFEIVDNRIVTTDVEPQECITKDNIPVHVNAVVYYRVRDPQKAVVEVENYHKATLEIAQTSLRSIIGQHSLDDLLSEVVLVSNQLEEVIDKATDPWGVEVSRVEIKDIQIPDEMRAAMAKQAEAERERRAQRIRAQGEKEAASTLVEAAQELERSEYGFYMRYLQTIVRVAEEGNTVVFASPGDNNAEVSLPTK